MAGTNDSDARPIAHDAPPTTTQPLTAGKTRRHHGVMARTFPKIAEVRAYIQRSELPDGEAAPPRNSVEACASLPHP